MNHHSILFITVIICSLGVMITTQRLYTSNHSFDETIMKNAEALASDESVHHCYNGGVGAISCSIDAGIDVFGFGLSSKCEVSCSAGFYACCGLRCICIPY